METDFCTCPSVWHGVVPPPLCSNCVSRYRMQGSREMHGWANLIQGEHRLSDEDVERIAKRVKEMMDGR